MQLDKDPEALAPIPDGTMGSLAIANGQDAAAYGRLGVLYQTLRGFYRCIVTQHNGGKSTDLCGISPEQGK